MKRLLFVLSFLLAGVAHGQVNRDPEVTVANLPTASAVSRATYIVTDGLTVGDCTTGGGVVRVECSSDGSVWVTFSTDHAAVTVDADHIDAITEIASGLKSGADATLITGTAGTSGNCSEWNADGDLVDSGAGCAGGGGSGTMTTVKEATVQVGGADIVTLDFGAGFDLAESPDTEINITLDLTEKQVVLTTEVTGSLPDANVDNDITINSTALITTGVGLDGIGAVDIDIGSGDITDVTFTTDGTGTAEIVLPAGSIDGTEILDGTIANVDINASAAIDLSKTALVAGTNITLSTNTLNVDDAFVSNSGDAIAGDLDFNDGATDSPKATFTPATGTAWDLYVEDTGDDFQIEVTTASTETIDIVNTGAGTINLTIDGTVDGVDISARDHAATVDTGPSPDCGGTETYQDGEGNCDGVAGDISGGLNALQVNDVQSATANTEAADNSTTQVATTAYVQQEINGAGGTNLSCSSGQCNVDDAFVSNSGDAIAGDLDFNDGATDSPKATFTPATGTAYSLFVADTDDDLRLEANTGATERFEITNIGAGQVDLDLDGALTLGTALAVAEGGTGATTLDDIVGGNGVTVVGGASTIIAGDATLTVEIKDNAENAVGSTQSVSGLEFESGELTLLQGCTDNQILKWDETADDWNCEADATAGGVDPGFDNAADPVVQQTTGSDVHIGDGADVVAGKLEVGGNADQPQVVIECFSTQTDDCVIVMNDDNTEVFTIDEDGVVTLGTDLGVAHGGTGASTLTDGGILLGSGTGPITALGQATNGQLPIGSTGADAVLATITAVANETDVTNAAGSITIGIVASPTLDGTNFTGIPSSAILTEVREIPIDLAAWNEDGTQCAAPTQVTIGSWGKQWTVICTDNDAATLTFTIAMPSGWDAGTVTLELYMIQDAADTGNFNADVAGRCTGDTETPAAYGTEVALDDTMTGTDAMNKVKSAAITLAGTCAGGDLVQLQLQVDATGTTTAMATLNLTKAKVGFTSNVGD